ncbi:MAG TPA: DUF2934 domain-containing protein [Blastocatellia bacterium]|jgi:hypothetical protein
MPKTAKTKNQASSVEQDSPVEQMAAPADAPQTGTIPTEEEIACRAYEIFLRRGGDHGNDIEDWLQAERELSEESES